MTPAELKILTDLAKGMDKIFGKDEEDYNKGARIADDYFCGGCGKRGIVGTCATCSEGGRL